MALSFSFPRRIDHPQIARKPIPVGARFFHVVNLASAADLTDAVKGWLVEAYAFAD